MKLYNNELNLVLNLVSDMCIDTTIEIHGELIFNLVENGKTIRRHLENKKLTIIICGGEIYINEIDNIAYQLSVYGIDMPLKDLKTFMWLDMLYFNRITVNGKNVDKRKFLVNLLDQYLHFLRCKCLTLHFKIKERIVVINYYKGGLVQRSYMDMATNQGMPFMTVFELTLDNLYERHNSIRLIGVAPNREIAYPEAYYKQLARVSNLKDYGSRFKFKKMEG